METHQTVLIVGYVLKVPWEQMDYRAPREKLVSQAIRALKDSPVFLGKLAYPGQLELEVIQEPWDLRDNLDTPEQQVKTD